jgi:hypothetical protein
VGVEGTNGVDHIVVGGSSGAVAVSGLASVVTIGGAEFLNDTLAINTLRREPPAASRAAPAAWGGSGAAGRLGRCRRRLCRYRR